MWGHSMGGHIALRIMVTNQDVKAGVIWAGVVAPYGDLRTRWHRTPNPNTPTRTPDERWQDDDQRPNETPQSNPTVYDSISANTYLSDISGPVQLHHGTDDETVPVVFSEILYQQMEEAGKAVELHIYEGDNHNIAKNFTQAMDRTIDFFDEYVKGN